MYKVEKLLKRYNLNLHRPVSVASKVLTKLLILEQNLTTNPNFIIVDSTDSNYSFVEDLDDSLINLAS